MRPWPTLLLLALIGCTALLVAAEAGSAAAAGTLDVDAIPPRPAGALTGSGFAASTTGLSGRQRQRRAQTELLSGNVPEFLRVFRPVHLTHQVDGSAVALTLWVAPDYLAVGSDGDFLRIPLDYPTATAVANRFGCVLPTPKIVDAIYNQADFRLSPQPMQPGPRMRSSGYYLRHHELIESQRAGRGRAELVSGHKKDVVITNRLIRNAKRVAIYGWHRDVGDPIQPLSTVHDAHYADYSHGVRLVWRRVEIDGRQVEIEALLRDPDLAPALTYEGTIRQVPTLMQRPEGRQTTRGSNDGG